MQDFSTPKIRGKTCNFLRFTNFKSLNIRDLLETPGYFSSFPKIAQWHPLVLGYWQTMYSHKDSLDFYLVYDILEEYRKG